MIKARSVPLRNGVFRVREGNLRVFWFYDQDKVVVCTHGKIKKSQKTKKDDLEYAIELKKRYFSLERTKIPIVKYED
jgi:phage-related protein